MTDETIVAVYDTPAHAELAAQDLKAAGILTHAISVHAATGSTKGDRTMEPPQERGFWSDLFGGEPDHDVDVYQRSVASGSTVVTVQVAEAHAESVLEILNSHHPVDIDERAASFGLTQNTPVTTSARADGYAASPATAKQDAGQTIQLSEEQLSVGKRVVNRGNTRIRRFVVETPVEEQVTLRDETVTVERRPVTGRETVANPDFTEKTIEVQALGEEAVIGKSARVVEEVTVGKQVSDRTETVRDTVRREDVEITKDAGDKSVTADRESGRVIPKV